VAGNGQHSHRPGLRAFFIRLSISVLGATKDLVHYRQAEGCTMLVAVQLL